MFLHVEALEAWVDFAGEKRRLSPDDQLLFGRGSGADLDIDDNPLLHRRFGRIYFRDGSWWLRNEGSRLPLTLKDRSSASAFNLAPGGEVSFTFAEAAISFAAGASNYEILIDLTSAPTSRPFVDDDLDGLGALDPTTVDHSQIPVVGGQRLLLVALAEQKLRHPHAPIALPTNKSVMHRLSWTPPQFNRKLDRLCAKFHRAGVPDMVDRHGRAAERRRRLVEHTVKHGIITTADLALLDDYPI